MARIQSAKHSKQQRKVETNIVQILPTRPAVDQPLLKNADPPPNYSESPPPEPTYLSFSDSLIVGQRWFSNRNMMRRQGPARTL